MTEEKSWLDASLEDDDFRREFAREEFVEDFLVQVEGRMQKRGLNRSALAKKMNCRPANVTRMLRKTSNLTIASMCDLAIALDCEIRPVLKGCEHLSGATLLVLPFKKPERVAWENNETSEDAPVQALAG